MASLQSLQEDDTENTRLIQDDDSATSAMFLTFRREEQNLDKEKTTFVSKTTNKRKRKSEEILSLDMLSELFLRIFYPISRCMSKGITVGLLKSAEYSPAIIINHGCKMMMFPENAWESFIKHLHLIECYLTSNSIGRKTSFRPLDCDIEVDIVKQRGVQLVRFRNLSTHDEKILLTKEEFFILSCVTSSVTRYMRQLVFSSLIIKDYLVDTMETQPNVQILHGPVDTAIFNRIPYEVEMWRRINEYKEKNNEEILPENDEKNTEDQTEGELVEEVKE